MQMRFLLAVGSGCWKNAVSKKESLNPNSRRLTIDLEQAHTAWGPVEVSVADFYERARPLVEETMAAADELLTRIDTASSKRFTSRAVDRIAAGGAGAA